jgi:hypothetical protein
MVWLLAQVEGDNKGGVAKQADGVEGEKQRGYRPAGMLVVASLILVCNVGGRGGCDVGEWDYFLLQGKSSRALGVSTPPT